MLSVELSFGTLLLVWSSSLRSLCTNLYMVALRVVFCPCTLPLSRKCDRGSITTRKCMFYLGLVRVELYGKLGWEYYPKLHSRSYFLPQNTTKTTQMQGCVIKIKILRSNTKSSTFLLRSPHVHHIIILLLHHAALQQRRLASRRSFWTKQKPTNGAYWIDDHPGRMTWAWEFPPTLE